MNSLPDPLKGEFEERRVKGESEKVKGLITVKR